MVVAAPSVHADNKRLNESVFVNIYTAQRKNGCTLEPRLDGRLVDAARRHTLDVLNNRDINGDIGSDGSTPQDRARDAGFVGKVAETVAINPAVAINGIEILNQWWYDPPSRATMQDCANTAIGVWSENSLSRSVVVAAYGQPAAP
nr:MULTISPECIES: CAP domain-containing protein [Mycolicibacter]